MRRITAVIISLVCITGSAFAEPEDEVRDLLGGGRFEEAFQLGQAHPERQGQPAFDFFFGIAAMESDHPEVGITVLERFVRNYPDNRSARYQLALGYYALAADARARAEFEWLLPQAQGDEHAAIERYLSAIAAREAQRKPSLNGFLEAGLGLDSNTNIGINGSSGAGIAAAVPSLGFGSTLQKPRRASFTSFAGEINGTHPLADGMKLTGTFAFDGRFYAGDKNDVYDQTSALATMALEHKLGDVATRYGASLGQTGLDNQRYVQTGTLFAEAEYPMSREHQFDLAGQAGRYNYSDMLVFVDADKTGARQLSQNSLRTANFVGLGAGWTWMMDGDLLPTLRLSANLGREYNLQGRDDLSRNIAGWRAAFSWAPVPRWNVVLAASEQVAHHWEANALQGYSDPRRDRLYGLEAGVAWRYDRNLTFKLDFARQKQTSNIGLYTYERDLLNFKLRYRFR